MSMYSIFFFFICRYSSLIQQYLSASYGDVLFANALLLPMQLSRQVKYRRAMWTEQSSVLRVFPLPLNNVSYWVQHESWYYVNNLADYQTVVLMKSQINYKASAICFRFNLKPINYNIVNRKKIEINIFEQTTSFN